MKDCGFCRSGFAQKKHKESAASEAQEARNREAALRSELLPRREAESFVRKRELEGAVYFREFHSITRAAPSFPYLPAPTHPPRTYINTPPPACP